MEAAGLVHRCPADDDARGVCPALTPAGRRLYGKASQAHRRSIEEHFQRHLSGAELDTVEGCFSRVGDAVLDTLSPPAAG